MFERYSIVPWADDVSLSPTLDSRTNRSMGIYNDVPVSPTSTCISPSIASSPQHNPTPNPTRIMTPETFTSFLLSPDNSAFTDQDGRVWQDMTRPLPEYYISSSHNTYLVGHQLVGVSTIEGYIRALLHSCRSVECTFLSFDLET